MVGFSSSVLFSRPRRGDALLSFLRKQESSLSAAGWQPQAQLGDGSAAKNRNVILAKAGIHFVVIPSRAKRSRGIYYKNCHCERGAAGRGNLRNRQYRRSGVRVTESISKPPIPASTFITLMPKVHASGTASLPPKKYLFDKTLHPPHNCLQFPGPLGQGKTSIMWLLYVR